MGKHGQKHVPVAVPGLNDCYRYATDNDAIVKAYGGSIVAKDKPLPYHSHLGSCWPDLFQWKTMKKNKKGKAVITLHEYMPFADPGSCWDLGLKPKVAAKKKK
eukprot:NODE_3276_length_576_cov_420.544592_g2760_i0.p1 GENE.NODE_3276_length_576_cov_420.544592_g2760_i0~~NODE_3276_length_576_cov_420.544592_g2760_i0.p1  ORF type:complete len:103 (+),score=20.58 NODE_3276_length_576_cov_420.544592_g2760_i0:63-371(+)